MTDYTEYVLTHWEEPDAKGRLVSQDGYVSVTPEWIYKQLQSFSPLGYREGEIALEIPIESLRDFWESLGGEIHEQ